jgi:hypothetical protein
VRRADDIKLQGALLARLASHPAILDITSVEKMPLSLFPEEFASSLSVRKDFQVPRFDADLKNKLSIAKVGVNYEFDWGTPVVARY